jgi:hypothetical protein
MFSGMTDRPSKPPAPPAAPPPGEPARERTSGRVQFDERGQAIWEWAVKTGMFDRNASTQRIRALVETPIELSIDESPPLPTGRHATSTGSLYERAAPPSDPSRAPSAPAPARTPPPRSAVPTTPARPGVAPPSPPVAPARPGGTAAPSRPSSGGGGNPYERAAPTGSMPGVKHSRAEPSLPKDGGGFDPYSRGPAKRPEATSYNPYERTPKKP